MTEIIQFIKWNLRGFFGIFKRLDAPGLFAIAIGAQFGLVLLSLGIHDEETLRLLNVTILCTIAVFFIYILVDYQWRKFKREQDKLISTLKTGK